MYHEADIMDLKVPYTRVVRYDLDLYRLGCFELILN